jgi:hypothetical protein
VRDLLYTTRVGPGWQHAAALEPDRGALTLWGGGQNSTRTGLTSLGDHQARAKVRASDVRLVFAWSSADLRLISQRLFCFLPSLTVSV